MTHNAVDLFVKGEQSGHRAECQSALILFDSNKDTKEVWFIPFEGDGLTQMTDYTFNFSFSAAAFDVYGFKVAVYRQYAKLSDTGTTNGIGELVTGTTYDSGALMGNQTKRDLGANLTPVVLPQGSYWVAFTPYVLMMSGNLTITTADGINAGTAGLTWVNQSHMYGVLATAGTFPAKLTTNGGTMTSLAGTFASGKPSFWAGVFDNRST